MTSSYAHQCMYLFSAVGIPFIEVNLMEWYCENDMEDLAVPKNEEIMDRLPSPDSWSSWGKVVGNFNSPNKLTILGVEEYLLRENMFDQPSFSQTSRRAFPQQRAAYPHERSDARLNDISALDEADDIFFCSLFEADGSATDGAESSANFTQTSSKNNNVTSDLSGERNHVQGLSNSAEHVGHFPHAMEPKFQGCFPDEHFIEHEYISEEDISMEESVLMELQRLTVQLGKKTRMCIRDSLYRLAENSRLQAKCHQDGKEDLESKPSTSSELSSLQESNAKEPDTKAVDRTVATLLFNTVNCCNFAEASTSGITTETPQKEDSDNFCLYTVPVGDAEVPTFGLTNQTSKRKFGT